MMLGGTTYMHLYVSVEMDSKFYIQHSVVLELNVQMSCYDFFW